jgi:CHAT domain-containing protein
MARVALLEYYITEVSSHVFLVKDGQAAPLIVELCWPDGRELTENDISLRGERLLVDFHGLPPDWDEEVNIEHFRQILTLPPQVNARKRSQKIWQNNLTKHAFSYQLDYLEELSTVLLPEVIRAEINDCDLLCIVPFGPLHGIPFAALRWSEKEYLIERFGICVTPSASVLRYCQQKNRARVDPLHRPSSCFVAASAAAEDQDPTVFEADGELLRSMFVARGGKFTLLVGSPFSAGTLPASKQLVREKIGGHDLVHLACHGLFGLDSTGGMLDSGLLLSDNGNPCTLQNFHNLTPVQRVPYFLSTREVFALNISADLVTLRACSSGRSSLKSGDELIGLTRAFMYAGASSLLVSLWDVNILSSQLLLETFYRFWLEHNPPMPKWQALQNAQIALLQSPELTYHHPYHWAPFVLIGDWL